MAEEAPDFAGLRRRGIAAAQAVSGGIWSDYNVHDPGVTLLEQVCFALTELCYRADLPLSDLLAGPDGRLDMARLGLGTPLEVLATRPVTARDLELALSAVHPAIERVIVRPRQGAEAGLHDLYVVPKPGAAADEALTAARRGFGGMRSLGEDLGTLALAVSVPCRPEGRIAIARGAEPERAAARIYRTCARLMLGVGSGVGAGVGADWRVPATRRDAFEDPARLFGASCDLDGGAAFLDLYIAALRQLEAVEEVQSLAFHRLDAPDLDAFAPIPAGAYRRLVLPAVGEAAGLRLVQGGLEVAFDLPAMLDKLARLEADAEGLRHSVLDGTDWAAPPPGRRRSFAHVPIADGLPPAFGIGRGAGPRAGGAAAPALARQLRGYVALLDAPLADAAAGLEALPNLFAGVAWPEGSYPSRPIDLSPWPDLAAGTAEDAAAAVAAADPWIDRRGRILDHLLALQGEAFPQERLRHFDLYRAPRARHRAGLDARARLLAELAVLNRDRAAGPDHARGERCCDIGLGRRLTILLDYPDRGSRRLAAPLRLLGLGLVPSYGADRPWRAARETIAAPGDPLDLLLPVPGDGTRRSAPSDPTRLVAETRFLAEGEIVAAALHAGIRSDAYLAVPEDGAWRLLLDAAGPDLLEVARVPSRAAAAARADDVRRLLVELNRDSEGLYVVEDVLLREAGEAVAPGLAIVQAGWTARTALPAFRRLAEEIVAAHCPAHLEARVLWLDPDAMDRFEALHLDWRVALREADAGAPARLPDARRALRDFLSGQGATP
jgi:hypothetical protein